MSAIPIIDVSPLLSGSSATAETIGKQIGAAARDVGFFYVAGHDVPLALMNEVFRHAAELFSAPAPIREAVAFNGASNNRGYIRMGGESLDPSQPPDMKEAFNIGLELAADDPEIVTGVPFRGVNLWPDLPEFRDTMLAYFNAVWRLGRDLHRGIAFDLGIAPGFFEDKLDRPMATLRLLHYPPAPGRLQDGQLGAGEHTDYGNLTLLVTDEIGGLMVRDRSGNWLDAPVLPGAFICNIGDCLMRWSNDVYVSTPHKVNAPKNADRYSVAFFLDPNPDALVACLPSCTAPGETPKYPPITGADFIRSRLEPTFAA